MILYVWANRNPNAVVRMPLFGFQYKAVYLPWSMLVIGMLMGNSPVFDLMGIAAGHVYYFLQDVLPNSEGAWGGKRLLYTPGFLSGLLGEQPSHLNPRERIDATMGRGGGAAGGGGYAWGGGGRVLGQ
jgi:Derlin-2/3